MLPHGFWHHVFGDGQVIEFRDVGDVDAGGAWQAVVAVHAVSLPADVREGRQCLGVVALRIGEFVVGNALLQLLDGMRTAADGRDTWAAQGVADALGGSQGDARRGDGCIEEVATAERLHDRDAHALFFAELVEFLTVRVHVEQRMVVGVGRPDSLHVLVGWLQVVAGIDAEHQDFDEAGLDSPARHDGIVRREADVPDAPRALEFGGVVEDAVPFDRLPVLQ